MIEQNEAYARLINILKELFQLDQADLDFGIYRIMNQKREEITDFLENRLVAQVKTTLGEHGEAEKEKLEKKLRKKEEDLRQDGFNPDESETVRNLRAQLLQADTTELQNTTFSHLTNFFKRYYKDGDFISQRRYKDDVYAIPYQGEEVKLHWANHDQYYIKTSEYFKNYRFKLRNGKWINFELREASTEQNNNKSQNGERKFKLAEENVYQEEGNALTIYFTYEPMSKKKKQDKLMSDAFNQLKEELPSAWLTELLQPKPTKKDKNRTVLQKHLKDYTARNTFDYFIHKDLGKFLCRELDFYVKNEILHIDDIDLDKEESYRQALQVIKAFKKVGLKIIEFLTQLEEFQKKLWLKKKFVLQSDYCITLDRIDEEFYADITANDRQREEWINLYAIDELEGYSKPLTTDFLKENKFLMADTQFYDREWKYKVLATIDQLDEQIGGLMINSENFQAIKILQERFKKQINCIYADPPYNAKSSEILYKNSFKHSSWMSFMHNRIDETKEILSKEGCSIIAIDENERDRLGLLLEEIFPDDVQDCITVVHNPAGVQGKNFSYTHESAIFVYPNDGEYIGFIERDDDLVSPLRDWGGTSARSLAKTCFYPIIVENDKIVGFGDVCPDDFHPGASNIKEGSVTKVYPVDKEGNERKWVFSRNSVEKNKNQLFIKKQDGEYVIMRRKSFRKYRTVWDDKKYYANIYGSKLLTNIMGELNFSFPKSVHTVEDSIGAITTLNNSNPYVLDYFAGSGTTAHAVINKNRKNESNLKYILVEMGEYFNTVTKPRVQKNAYSKKWKDGKPIDREGISHMFKYLRLESYEDTLNNLKLNRTEQQQGVLESEVLSEEYYLRYMLEVESRDSLLSTEMFKRPFGYTLQATEHNERVETEVDLVETFNYLIGLTVESLQMIRGYVVVTGHNNDGERILVIWRDTEKQSNQDLEEFVDKMEFNPHDSEFDLIYVNGDNNLQNIRKDEETWKVRLIEEEFHKRMFETEGL